MSASRLQPHHSLPAPVVHATFSAPQSKSHVLAGVQDAYWSDDEAEDAECPLCLEEMDISDLNFKPCICGYQICRFCWHHIKENLNKRCPACRRIYTDDAVEFKPIATQDHKRLTQQKKQRDRERRDLEALGRRHLSNVRVVQRNVVYVVGIGPRFAKEELIPTLRSNEYFGQYGKISKILLVKRNPPGGSGPVVGLYITYHRREDASRAIAAVDGTPSPGGGRDVMRASHGTTKYCMAFLRGVPCSDHSCMNLHEWGDEKDCFTKEDLATLKHTIKATESRSRTGISKKIVDNGSVPRSTSWAKKDNTSSMGSLNANANQATSGPNSLASRQPRRTGGARLSRTVVNNIALSSQDSRSGAAKPPTERKIASDIATPPSTPILSDSLRSGSANESKELKQVEVPASTSSPAPSTTAASDISSIQPESVPSTSTRPNSANSQVNSTTSAKGSNSLLFPPGLSVPPGISSPSRPPRAETASPQTPLLEFQTSYQMSNAARALIDDVKARREAVVPTTSVLSPFPDFDRTLQTLSAEDGGGFSFNMDPNLASEVESADQLPDFGDAASSIPFNGSYLDAFPALRTSYLPLRSASHSQNTNHPIFDPSVSRLASGSFAEKHPTSYFGSFNPFSDPLEGSVLSSPSSKKSRYSPIDEERKVSRFGFARGRQNSTSTSSPLQSVSPVSYAAEQDTFYQFSEDINQLYLGSRDDHVPIPQLSALSAQQAAPHSSYHPVPPRPLSENLSEAQLRSFIQLSQENNNDRYNGSTQQFEDPAIMSASFTGTEHVYGHPPGIPLPRRLSPLSPMSQSHQNSVMEDAISGQVPAVILRTSPTLLSEEDFPALTPSISDPPSALLPQIGQHSQIKSDSKIQEKAERKFSKKAADLQKPTESQRIAQEKVLAKAVRVPIEKVPEKQKVSSLKLEQREAPDNIRHNAETNSQKKTPSLPRHQPDKQNVQKITSKTTSIPLNPRQKDQNTRTFKPSFQALRSSNVSEIFRNDSDSQLPLLSKKPKKSKASIRIVKLSKEDDTHEELTPSALDTSQPSGFADSNLTHSISPFLEQRQSPTPIHDILEQLNANNPGMALAKNPFFDIHKLASPIKMPLEYGPLVHALSALSVGGGSFANNMPSGSIDNAVSSFQQLLETLTQTISDLLRLLPRTTWDDSSSFDGVLRDMLKGDDFLDEGDEGAKEDEVTALTLALERRARWMEVQLSKLEELHRDINTAAVRAVLSFNDSGWDRNGFLPRLGNTLRRFDNIGIVEQDGEMVYMNADELEKKLAVAKEATIFAETEIREAMERFQNLNLYSHGLY